MNSAGPGRAQPGALRADPLAGLREVLRATRPDADTGLIRRAYDVAAAWHHGQTRMSGDPHITHPLAVAMILARLGADDQTLCAALLHDVIDYTPCTPAELRREFGAEIAALVSEIAALDQMKAGRGRARARAMAAAQSADARALATMLADRLHNMRTVEFLPQEKQLRKARESLDFFVPAARLLSMDTVESELATLASATLRRNRHARTASGRLLTAMTALLPAAVRTRWREEWLGELHTLPARRSRARFAAHTLLGVPRLAVTLRRPAPGNRRAPS
jgi:(p)ppGpp synthase/HD superfamily hydrolase